MLACSGRSLPTSSLLGPAFSVSVLPDSVGKPQPDVRVQYFSNIDSRSQPEISATLHSMQVTSNQIAGSLHAMVKTLLSKVWSSAELRNNLNFDPLGWARPGKAVLVEILLRCAMIRSDAQGRYESRTHGSPWSRGSQAFWSQMLSAPRQWWTPK